MAWFNTDACTQMYLHGMRRESALTMTPAEMCVLFCAEILAFSCIWFTRFAERGQAADLQVPQQAKQEHLYNFIDVAGFFHSKKG